MEKNRKKIMENGLLQQYAGHEKNYRVPAGTVRIGTGAFFGNGDIRTVEIPEGVKEIGAGAFRYCSRLKSVRIPGSVSRIGEGAFMQCPKLESIEIPCGVRRIEKETFWECFSLKSVILPDGLEEIGESAFISCTGLEEISFPDSLKKMGEKAFQGCRQLRLIKEPDCTPDIGEKAFDGCGPEIMEAFQSALRRKIDMYTGCIVRITNLRRHSREGSLQCTTIAGHSVVVDGACRIGQLYVYFPVGGQLDEEFARENHLLRDDEFGNETGYCLHPVKRNIVPVRIKGEVSEGLALPVEVLKKYTDTDSLKEGDRIFTLNGHPICQAYIPNGMDIDLKRKTLVRCKVRKGSDGKVYIPWGTEHIGDEAFMGSRFITDVWIPETVTTIGRRAFYDCQKLINVNIPGSVESIGEEAFAHCEILKGPVLPENLKQSEERIMTARDFIIRDGVLTDFIGCSPDVIIPGGVKEIGKSAFAASQSLESVVIPKGVTKIGDRAFAGCKALKKVSIPGSVTYIGYKAFYECRALHEVTVPPSVEYIGSHAFGVYLFYKYIEGFKFPYEEYRRYSDFRIRCTEGSRVEYYAIENRLSYTT